MGSLINFANHFSSQTPSLPTTRFFIEDDESRDNDRVALIIVDRYTRWLQGFAAQSKEHSEIVRDLQRFLGPQTKPKHVYTDNSKEFITAMKQLNWTHDTPTPHKPQTNGVVERAARVIKEGTICALVQSGLADKWWPEAMDCFCYLRNVSVVLETGKTAYQERFASDFKGPLIPSSYPLRGCSPLRSHFR